MQSKIDPGHPKQQLLFRLAEPDAGLKVRLADLIEILAASRHWVIGPPVYVDEVEAAEPPDHPVEIVGGLLEIYSELPPNRLPLDVSRQHLEEVEFIVSALQDFSRRAGAAFELQLGLTHVGSIEDGASDRSLQAGLLEPWREAVA